MSFRAAMNLLLLLVLLIPYSASAQAVTGTPPFGSFGGGPDVVNLANLNVHWALPVLHKPGRGLNFNYDLSYDTYTWYPNGATWQPVANWGWGALTTGGVSYFVVGQSHSSCTDPSNPGQQLYDVYHFTQYIDQYGTMHGVFLTVDDRDTITSCTPDGNSTKSKLLTDGSGLNVTVDAGLFGTVVKPDGTVEDPSVVSSPFSATDRNGNVITSSTSGQFFDTLSSTTPVLTIAGTGNPTSPKTFTYTVPSGASASYTMKYTTYSIQTNFGCSGITDYGVNGTMTATLV